MAKQRDLSYAIVIPTTGRESLHTLLTTLDESQPNPVEVVIVDDRPTARPPLTLPRGGFPVRVLPSGGGGPAAARNVGWESTEADWVVFIDDDVLPTVDWGIQLEQDLRLAQVRVGGCQGNIEVPLPKDRSPTDWERGTAGLTRAWWITADMAYRWEALAAAGGFDERFPRAFREDADLAMRVRLAGFELTMGTRTTQHPVRPAGFFASVRAQAGNADNALMRREYGRHWRRRVGENPGRTSHYAVTVTSAVVALGAMAWDLARQPISKKLGRSPLWTATVSVASLVWLAATVEFAARRIGAGPWTVREIVRMSVTSLAIPPVALWYRLLGELRVRRERSTSHPLQRPSSSRTTAKAVLFDRDDTLIEDVPYNGEPAKVRPLPGVREALDRLRTRGIAIGVVSNQSGVARDLLSADQVRAVNAEVDRQLGPFETWRVCVHDEEGSCRCRKPAPGLIETAASDVDVFPDSCVVIGDTGADVDAALAAGARAILVPTARTRRSEIRRARRNAEVARTLPQAVGRVLGGGR